MHRHTAIKLSLLCADITYDTNNCYVPKTLTKTSFSKGQIKGCANPDLQPGKIIQEIFDGTRTDAPVLKSKLTVTSYIPTMRVKDMDRMLEVTQTQSQYVSNNKLNSAMLTLSTTLGDWLTLCSTVIDQPASENKKPAINHRIMLHAAMTDTGY
jgi:hypothetical protein